MKSDVNVLVFSCILQVIIICFMMRVYFFNCVKSCLLLRRKNLVYGTTIYAIKKKKNVIGLNIFLSRYQNVLCCLRLYFKK